MDRNVYASERADAGVRGDGAGAGGDRFKGTAGKLVKYFPAEAFALYATLEPLIKEGADDDLNLLKWLLWVTLAATTVFCFFFLKKFWSVKRDVQALISCAALVVYVAALGGPFSTIDGYKPLYALIAAALLAAVFVFAPAPEKPAGN